ncbi:unnamed protein product [Acanthoscelides obtectus]|uniref:Uncharacterized protein n=1 Tax=Acanthoscelides obtectus TaxID=200917 RepID=A0A9P0JN60_ACAOB|nr:unnamed protein product [Acanthoscelides obtectus]CAK1662122.1 hypothetical protein AOBTE_LOCUS22998 [Acanthoscelides obtectus]
MSTLTHNSLHMYPGPSEELDTIKR